MLTFHSQFELSLVKSRREKVSLNSKLLSVSYQVCLSTEVSEHYSTGTGVACIEKAAKEYQDHEQ